MAQPVDGDLLTSPVRREIMTLLAHPDHTKGLTAQEVGDHVHLHVTTARFHLDQLVRARLVTTRFQRGGGAGRPRKLYAAQPTVARRAQAVHGHEQLAQLLAESFLAPDTERSPELIGRRWARRNVPEHLALPADGSTPQAAETPDEWVDRLGQVLDVLKDSGYAPTTRMSLDSRTADVTLHQCPVIDLARQHTELVCGIHLGAIRETLAMLGEPEAEVLLVPFAGPSRCTTQICTHNTFITHPQGEAS